MVRITLDKPYIPIPVPITAVKYGLLYNWYAVTDARGLFPDGWRLPYDNEFDAFIAQSNALREVGTEHWNAPNTGATNEYGFNARGSGMRNRSDGAFYNLKNYARYWCTPIDPETTGTEAAEFLVSLTSAYLTYTNYFKYGFAVRPVKESTTLTHGQTGAYTGNDGREYSTICIGGVEYLASNLAETKYRNGDAIPEVTGNSAWAALTTGALCAYNNDWSNVLI